LTSVAVKTLRTCQTLILCDLSELSYKSLFVLLSNTFISLSKINLDYNVMLTDIEYTNSRVCGVSMLNSIA